MTTKPDVLDEIISQIDPEEVPLEFIVMAKITTFDGEEKIITGSELEVMMENPDQHNVLEARVILDIRKIRQTIQKETAKIFKAVRKLG
jgi:hypothetical protein